MVPGLEGTEGAVWDAARRDTVFTSLSEADQRKMVCTAVSLGSEKGIKELRKVLVQRLTVVHILVQHTLLHDTVKLHRIPLLTFDARAGQARRQPASVLLALVGFVFVGEHYVDSVVWARSQRLDRQLFCNLVDLESGTEAISDDIIIILGSLESAHVDRHCSVIQDSSCTCGLSLRTCELPAEVDLV